MNNDPLASYTAAPNSDARESFRLVLGASALTVALWFIPFVGLVLYPIRLFVTYIHEICHAVASIITFGWPHEIEIYWNTAGITQTSNMNVVVASAGYVGTALVGAMLLLLAARRRTVRPAMVGTGVVLLVATVFLGGNLLAWLAGLSIGVTLVAIGAKASSWIARFALSFLAIQCILNALTDLKFLFWLSMGGPAQTDAQNMANATYIPAVFWSALCAVIAVAVLGVALRVYYVTTVRHSLS